LEQHESIISIHSEFEMNVINKNGNQNRATEESKIEFSPKCLVAKDLEQNAIGVQKVVKNYNTSINDL
tara:strand:+ start:255 stop:458 length:204 start_codon:yes stop_codon:yes gene_type:complete